MQIFIADVTDDFRLSKKRLIKKLEEMKATVHSRLPPPFLMDLHDQTYNTTIVNCDVSVHILSQYPGRTFEDSENVYISIHQAQTGLKGNNRRVFWIPKNLEFEDVDEKEYREFLSTLEFGFEEDGKFILVKGDPQTMDTDIVKEIPFSPAASTRSGILIVHHPKDEDGAIRVSQKAQERNIMIQYSTSGGDNPDSNLKVLADQLKNIEQVILVVGSVNSEWANERAKHILTTIIQKDYYVNSIGFYFTPDAQETFHFNGRFLPVKMLDETKKVEELEAWDKFLNPQVHD